MLNRIQPRPVRITIIDDSTIELCDANCGIDWSKPEAVDLARQRISERFGDQAELEYLDLPKARRTKRLHDIKTRIAGLPMPVLLSNGHPRIAGEFDTRQLLDVIEVDLETEV